MWGTAREVLFYDCGVNAWVGILTFWLNTSVSPAYIVIYWYETIVYSVLFCVHISVPGFNEINIYSKILLLISGMSILIPAYITKEYIIECLICNWNGLIYLMIGSFGWSKNIYPENTIFAHDFLVIFCLYKLPLFKWFLNI